MKHNTSKNEFLFSLRKVPFVAPGLKCFISIHLVLCIVFAYVAGGGMYLYVYIF